MVTLHIKYSVYLCFYLSPKNFSSELLLYTVRLIKLTVLRLCVSPGVKQIITFSSIQWKTTKLVNHLFFRSVLILCVAATPQ